MPGEKANRAPVFYRWRGKYLLLEELESSQEWKEAGITRSVFFRRVNQQRWPIERAIATKIVAKSMEREAL